MEKRRKLNVELIKFLIGSMLVVGVLMLLGSSLVNNRQYRKLYNDKALEIAKAVSDQVWVTAAVLIFLHFMKNHSL